MRDSRVPCYPMDMRRSPRVVMFDLDGTLIDTMGGFADIAADVMAVRHGADRATARRRYLETSGLPFRQQLEVIHPAHSANDDAAAEFEHRKRTHAEQADLDDATLMALALLRGLGMKLVVSSNASQAFVDEFASRTRIRFDLVLGFDDATGFAKGRPHVEHVCRQLGASTDDILFVGDSLNDGELAQQCGIRFIGRLGTFTHDDFRRWNAMVATVTTIRELTDRIAMRVAA